MTIRTTVTMPQGEALMGSGAVLIWNDVAAAARRQFYDWHDKEHIPERLDIPGFRRGRRYICPDHSPEWFTMYEANDPSVVASPQYFARLNAPTPGTQEMLKHFQNTSRAVCRVAGSLGSSSGGHILTLRLQAPEEADDALQALAMQRLFPRALQLTGVVACHLYAADQSASFTNTAESRTRSFDVPSWVLLAEMTTLAASEEVRGVLDGAELSGLGVQIREDAAIYALEICRLASRGQPGDGDQ